MKHRPPCPPSRASAALRALTAAICTLLAFGPGTAAAQTEELYGGDAYELPEAPDSKEYDRSVPGRDGGMILGGEEEGTILPGRDGGVIYGGDEHGGMAPGREGSGGVLGGGGSGEDWGELDGAGAPDGGDGGDWGGE